MELKILMMIGPVPLGAVINRFDDAVGHPQSQDRQGIPQAAHEYQVPRIPNPFKIKWKHYFPPLGVHRFKVHRSGLPCVYIPGSFDIFCVFPIMHIK